MADDRGARKPPRDETPPTPRRIVLPRPRLTPPGTPKVPGPPRVPPAASKRTQRLSSAVHEKPKPVIAIHKVEATSDSNRPSNVPTPVVPPPQSLVIVGSGFEMSEALVKGLVRQGL